MDATLQRSHQNYQVQLQQALWSSGTLLFTFTKTLLSHVSCHLSQKKEVHTDTTLPADSMWFYLLAAQYVKHH